MGGCDGNSVLIKPGVILATGAIEIENQKKLRQELEEIAEANKYPKEKICYEHEVFQMNGKVYRAISIKALDFFTI